MQMCGKQILCPKLLTILNKTKIILAAPSFLPLPSFHYFLAKICPHCLADKNIWWVPKLKQDPWAHLCTRLVCVQCLEFCKMTMYFSKSELHIACSAQDTKEERKDYFECTLFPQQPSLPLLKWCSWLWYVPCDIPIMQRHHTAPLLRRYVSTKWPSTEHVRVGCERLVNQTTRCL